MIHWNHRNINTFILISYHLHLPICRTLQPIQNRIFRLPGFWTLLWHIWQNPWIRDSPKARTTQMQMLQTHSYICPSSGVRTYDLTVRAWYPSNYVHNLNKYLLIYYILSAGLNKDIEAERRKNSATVPACSLRYCDFQFLNTKVSRLPCNRVKLLLSSTIILKCEYFKCVVPCFTEEAQVGWNHVKQIELIKVTVKM